MPRIKTLYQCSMILRAVQRLLPLLLVSALGTSFSGVARSQVDENDATGTQVIHLKMPLDSQDPIYRKRGIYSQELARLILDKMNATYRIESVDLPKVPSARTMRLLKDHFYTLAPMHTDPQREQELLPIRIPIYRGLSGWRIFFVRSDNPRLKSATSAELLKILNAGQGHDWPDTPILKANGFSVVTAFSRDSIFKQLQLKRIDYFPRGIYEIWDEHDLAEAEGLIINTNLLLHYPTATYFFVAKENEALADLLTRGFEMAISDGSFQKLFMSFAGEAIKNSRLLQRQLIEISNPFLSNETPLARKELWFNLDEIQ